MRDPYTVLGLAKTADEKQIKSAFRQLAMKYHPDHNKDDKSAQAKFAEINQAYEVLGDKAKRAQFDRGEIDAEGKPRFSAGMGGSGFGGAGGFGSGRASGFEHFDFGGMGGGARRGRAGGFNFDDLGDIFGGAFGAGGMGRGGRARPEQAQPRKGADITAALNVSPAQIVGAEKVEVAFSDGKRLKIKLPDYLEDGQTIRLKGQGQQAPGALSGDALITIHFQADPRFRLEGRDVHMDLPISLKKAVLGGKQNARTLDGAVALTVPAWVSSGKALRLQGRGLPLKTGGRGALYAHLQIELPAEKDSRLTELMQTYAD